jgi:hypothetical protein
MGWMAGGDTEWSETDAVDGRLKLRFPSKIMLDIDTCQLDKKIKTCII